jgi:hypothetical protein
VADGKFNCEHVTRVKMQGSKQGGLNSGRKPVNTLVGDAGWERHEEGQREGWPGIHGGFKGYQ